MGCHAAAMNESTNLTPLAVVDGATPLRGAAQRLRSTLRLNAATSLVGGLLAASAPGTLDGFFGSGRPALVRAIGLGLVVFSLVLVWLAGERVRRLQALGHLVVAADMSWVLASGVLMVAGPLRPAGLVLVGGVAAMVAAFAVRQWRQLVALGTHTSGAPASVLDEAPPTEVVEVRRPFDGDPVDAWAAITDDDLYAALALNLSSVTATSPPGPGATRTCADLRGRSWSESCTVWDPGTRFDVVVHTDAPHYPYPLSELRGSWWVQARDGRNFLGMDFRVRPERGLRARVYVLLMQGAFPLVLRRILAGWEAATAKVGGDRGHG